MQKISTYLYKNRYQLVADLAGFLTEYKIVYQRQIKVYKGIDNTIEFDVKNADQKRIDLSTLDEDSIQMNVMDHNGYALPNSPYLITPLDQETLKGIASVTIPAEDIADIDDQFLTFSVSAAQDSVPVLLYGDTKFGAAGVIELIGTAFPIVRGIETYDDFYGLGTFDNKSISYSSSSVHLKYRQAVKPNHVHIIITCTDFIGEIWVEATKDEVVGNESFTYKGTRLFEDTYTVVQNGILELPIIMIEDYKNLRVNWSKLGTSAGKVNQFTIEFHMHDPEVPC
jgi:hypothetical protein